MERGGGMCFLFAGGNEQSCLGLVFPGVSEWKGRSSVRRELRPRGRLPLLPGRPRRTVPFQTQILTQTLIQIQNPRESVGTSPPQDCLSAVHISCGPSCACGSPGHLPKSSPTPPHRPFLHVGAYLIYFCVTRGWKIPPVDIC